MLLTISIYTGTEVLHAASILGDKGTVKVFSVTCEIVDGLTSKLRNLGLHSILTSVMYR